MNPMARFAAVSLLTVAACDPQDSTNYVGDPIWTLQGSLIAPQGVAADTEVALLWEGVEMQLLTPTEVEGNFPAEFTLRTYEPPPARALLAMSSVGLEAVIGFGNILAVEPSAPFYPKLGYHGDDPGSLALEPGESLVTQEELLAPVQGGVASYLVVYFEGEDGGLACLEQLDQGYNLFEVRPFTEAEDQAGSAWYDATLTTVLAEYNAEHGTSFDAETYTDDPAAAAAIDTEMGRRQCDAGYLVKAHAERVDTDQRVSMELEPDFEYVDWN
jgi:hypothetical protein